MFIGLDIQVAPLISVLAFQYVIPLQPLPASLHLSDWATARHGRHGTRLAEPYLDLR